MVQCGLCGNKWKQFPTRRSKKNSIDFSSSKSSFQDISRVNKKFKSQKNKKTAPKKQREISLYSPEYLAKKHGIKINDAQPVKKISKEKGKVSFGFYNSLILIFFSIFFI